MAKQSAGIVVFRKVRGEAQFLLVHPGGPFWAKKNKGSWSIPKGLYDDPEDALTAAKRELKEETGIIATGEFIELGKFEQPSGKIILAWATQGDFDPANLSSNTFSLEWPPKSGKISEFPEIDQAAWFSIAQAAWKITKGQLSILTTLAQKLGINVPAEM